MTEDLAAASLAVEAAGLPVQRRRPFEVTWHSFDLRTGRRGAPVRVKQQPSPSRFLNEATEVTVEVVIWDKGREVPDWEASTQPGWTMLVALDEDERPLWGGYVFRRVATSGTTVSCTLQTLEGYLDRRFVITNFEFIDADQVSTIARTLIEHTTEDGVQFVVDTPFSNWRRDRTYLIDEDKTIFSALEELAGVENGIEFTVDLQWRNQDRLVLDRVIRVRNRVGTAYLGSFGTDSNQPITEFRMPGTVQGFTYVEDYSAENGANAVLAVSSGEGDDRPESALWIAGGVTATYGPGNQPMFERRFTPSTSIISRAVLNEHASRELEEVWDGLLEFELEVSLDHGPRVDQDWFLGDDVTVILTCPRFPERVDNQGERHPGFVGKMRLIGYEIDFGARVIKPRVVGFNEVETVVI